MQHVASWMAKTLTRMYSEIGTPLDHPITIIVQDPRYSAEDRHLLPRLFNIEVVSDPQAFLSIDSSSLVMFHASMIPIRAIIGDLDVSPAAIFMDLCKDTRRLMEMEIGWIHFNSDCNDEPIPNPLTRRMLEKLKRLRHSLGIDIVIRIEQRFP